jgi:hypothetical protein
MPKSIKVTPKKSRGRPATGKDPHVTARMPASLIEQVEAWAAANETGRSEAIRRLVEIGLSKTPDQPRILSTSTEGAARAAELAGKVIDKKIDPKAPAEEREVRKRKLVKGPGEFRNARVDRPKVRGK